MKLTPKARQMNFRAGKIIADLQNMGLHFHAGVLQELLVSNANLRAASSRHHADAMQARQQLAALQHRARNRLISPTSLPAVAKPLEEPIGSAGREDQVQELAA